MIRAVSLGVQSRNWEVSIERTRLLFPCEPCLPGLLLLLIPFNIPIEPAGAIPRLGSAYMLHEGKVYSL